MTVNNQNAQLADSEDRESVSDNEEEKEDILEVELSRIDIIGILVKI